MSLEQISVFLFRHEIRGATRFHGFFGNQQRLTVRTKHGLRLRVDPYEYVDGFILRCGYYEEEVLEAILENVGVGEVFWDVGSNLGLHALTLARLRPDLRVHAFEPNPAMVTLIREAEARNGLSVVLHEVALSSRTGIGPLFIHPGNAGMSSLHNWHGDDKQPHIPVPLTLGDEVVRTSPEVTPNVLKIDVEGAEVEVLRGVPATLANPSLHTVIFEDRTAADSPAKEILRAAGFAVRQLNRREAAHHDLENFIARRGRG